MLKRRLFTPGPVPVPERVLLAMAQPVIHHRAPDFLPVFAACKRGLQRLFQTECPVLILAASGTGAMDAAVSNLLSPGDHALVIRGGKFGERWQEICEAYGVRTTCIDVDVGPGRRAGRGRAPRSTPTPTSRRVFVQASETSTARVPPDRARSREIVRRSDDRLLVVDGITAIGVHDLPMDAWGLDVVISGTQKAFMMPPGLAFLALSERAQRLHEDGARPALLLLARQGARGAAHRPDLLDARGGPAPGPAPTRSRSSSTRRASRPPGRAPRSSRPPRARRCARSASICSRPTRRAPPARPCACRRASTAPRCASICATSSATRSPTARGKLKGKIFRIAHLGYFDRFDTIACIAAVEMALAAQGYVHKLGEGARTATELLRD